MKTFTDQQPGDLVTFEMRVSEVTRKMLQAMFVSAEENKRLLENALEDALLTLNIRQIMQREASTAIQEAVHDYFTIGEGARLISGAVNDALSKTIPGLFSSTTSESKGKP